ncbi:arginase [Halonatronum saccharophilum]|uniref:arginase n=1 Tax=Halonatronum saccharophilum TaxID=150060 RepID=UPI0004834252|nr:arginase [Halonatronum saccharophilum]
MKYKVIGVPTDFGANRRGVDMGPSAIRYAHLVEEIEKMGLNVEDLGDLPIPILRRKNTKEEVKFLTEVVEICDLLAFKVERVIRDGNFPIILGGDHSISMGSVGGAARANKELGLIWIDAHGDFNTYESSQSGNIHGMPLAAILGRGEENLVRCGGIHPKVKEVNTVLVGVRDLDREEAKLLKTSQVTVFTMDDIDRKGIYQVMEEAIKISSQNVESVHLSFDIDVLDPLEAPGVGTPVKGGLTYREAHLAMEMLFEANILRSMDLVEVNPILDKYNKSAQLAVDLITSALGKKVY